MRRLFLSAFVAACGGKGDEAPFDEHAPVLEEAVRRLRYEPQ